MFYVVHYITFLALVNNFSQIKINGFPMIGDRLLLLPGGGKVFQLAAEFLIYKKEKRASFNALQQCR